MYRRECGHIGAAHGGKSQQSSSTVQEYSGEVTVMMMSPNQKSPKPGPDVTEPDVRDDPDDLPDYGDPPVEEPPQAPGQGGEIRSQAH